MGKIKMNFDEVIKKRLRGMAVRILANIEHVLGADDLEDLSDDDTVTITGGDLKIIRSEVLNAAGDTTRSLQGGGNRSADNKISLSRDMIQAINKAHVDIIEVDGEEVPLFKIEGSFNLVNKIRTGIGTGVVYNKTYTCAGIEDVVNSLLPYLDMAQIASVKIAKGDYKDWRDAVCELYLEGLQ